MRLNGSKAAGKTITLNVNFTDLKKDYGTDGRKRRAQLRLSTGTHANARLTLDKAMLDDVLLGNVKLDDAITQNKATFDGNRGSLDEFMGLLDTFPFWFNIVTP